MRRLRLIGPIGANARDLTMNDSHDARDEAVPLPPVSVTWTGSLYRIVEPKLAITVEDADLAAGYAKFRQIRAEVLRNLLDAGVPLPGAPDEPVEANAPRPRTPPPSSGATAAAGRSSTRTLALIFALVGFGIVLSYQLLVSPILQRIDRITTLVQNADPYANTREASRALARLADLVQQITPERKKELRQNLRIIVREMRPLTLELVPLFDLAAPPVAPRAEGSKAAPEGQPRPDPARSEQP